MLQLYPPGQPRRPKTFRTFSLGTALILAAELAAAQNTYPTAAGAGLVVTGRGEAYAKPDRVVLRLGAVVQAPEAASAQQEVNEIMNRALKAIRDLELPDTQIQTASLTLSPVYENPERPREGRAPRLAGYRAGNTIEIQTAALERIGEVIDRGVAAGANQLQGLSFQLRKDLESRALALRQAIEEARLKAEVMARALGVRLGPVQQAAEGGVEIVRPRFEDGRLGVAMAQQSTQIEPGEIRVEASVTVHYQIEQTPGNAPARNQ